MIELYFKLRFLLEIIGIAIPVILIVVYVIHSIIHK